MAAHRLVVEVLRGPIPDGMVVDHTCHVPGECPGGPLCPHRPCINPEHLEVVPPAMNTSIARAARLRPEQCKRGHVFSPENTYTDSRGSRHCRACAAERARTAHKKEPRPPRDRCKNGHELTPDNIVVSGQDNKQRRCLQCRRDRSARYEARKRTATRTT
ncbi:HNH endonuclease [Streptomyces sp. NPDC047981]|uniref:HNH endonuclease n=1 Tax=Streptomyces sp. NPDC047981 TaxID=3154610 RepID=UPI00343092F4